jgi:hypothetical protein
VNLENKVPVVLTRKEEIKSYSSSLVVGFLVLMRTECNSAAGLGRRIQAYSVHSKFLALLIWSKEPGRRTFRFCQQQR